MARLKTDAIQLADLNEYIDSSSDFSFEMSVLRTVRENDFQCEHAGHYDDPVSQKSREFDIRALHSEGAFKIRLAVECKNIRENFPILVSCVRRTKAEAYFDIATIMGEAPNSEVRVHPIRNQNLYREGEWVVKSIAQVGRSADQANSLTSNDSEVYDKWGQALASAHDLFFQISEDEDLTKGGLVGFGLVFPMIVVPDGRLWSIHYNEDGTIAKAPHQVNRVSFYIGKEYSTGLTFNDPTMRVSHVEILTQSGLADFLQNQMDIDRIISGNDANRILRALGKR